MSMGRLCDRNHLIVSFALSPLILIKMGLFLFLSYVMNGDAGYKVKSFPREA